MWSCFTFDFCSARARASTSSRRNSCSAWKSRRCLRAPWSYPEKKGKSIHLAVAAATEKWEAILRAAQNMQSSTVVLGSSPNTPVIEEARIAGLAWERLPDPKPQLTLEVYFPGGQEHIFYLGPHAPRLTRKEIDLLHGLWLEVSKDVAPQELHHHDVVHFALEELRHELGDAARDDVIRRLRYHLEQIQGARSAPPQSRAPM